MGVELREEDVYCPPMADKPTLTAVPAGWLDVLAESEVELAAGLTVDGDQIVRDLYATADGSVQPVAAVIRAMLEQSRLDIAEGRLKPLARVLDRLRPIANEVRMRRA